MSVAIDGLHVMRSFSQMNSEINKNREASCSGDDDHTGMKIRGEAYESLCETAKLFCESGADEAVKSDSKAALAIIPCP